MIPWGKSGACPPLMGLVSLSTLPAAQLPRLRKYESAINMRNGLFIRHSGNLRLVGHERWNSCPVLGLHTISLLPSVCFCYPTRLQAGQAHGLTRSVIGGDFHVQSRTAVAQVLGRKHSTFLADEQRSLRSKSAC
jgi:hypothetical protein